MSDDNYVTTRVVADEMDCSIWTASLWCRQGRFPGAFQVNAETGHREMWIIPRDDLEALKRNPPQVGYPKGRPRR